MEMDVTAYSVEELSHARLSTVAGGGRYFWILSDDPTRLWSELKQGFIDGWNAERGG
jgi:hypothetical protein